MAKRKGGRSKPTTKKRKVASVPRSVPEVSREGNSSINIKKIQNGLIVRISKDTGKKYVEKEFFAKTEKEVKAIVAKAL